MGRGEEVNSETEIVDFLLLVLIGRMPMEAIHYYIKSSTFVFGIRQIESCNIFNLLQVINVLQLKSFFLPTIVCQHDMWGTIVDGITLDVATCCLNKRPADNHQHHDQ